MKIKVIITGVTGMVGEGVLAEALDHTEVEKVLVINRQPCGVSHPKLSEIIHRDFLDLSPVSDKLRDFNACFFCLGVSSAGMKKEEYYTVTYTLTMHMAEMLAKQNHEMTFCYISGAGTDGTERGRISWARVKGKVENDLMKLSFKKVYNFRPGMLIPSPGMKKVHKYYRRFSFLIPVIKAFTPNMVSTLKELGLAMINSVLRGYDKPVLEVKDIKILAKNS